MHSSFFQLGRLHIPAFGFFAALGLMSALALSQKIARYAGLDANAVWNAGVTAVVSAFVISRVLLIAFNWQSFLQYPVLVMALPSLTGTGMALTILFMLAYLRVRGLPLVAFLDAMAPCVALLWMFLSAGRFVEGTRDGMATRLAWGAGEGPAVRVHPVELYTLAAAAAVCFVVLRGLKAKRQVGWAAGTGLALAGLAIYFIDFFRLPSDLLADAWLDPAEALAVAMIVAGAALVLRRETKIQEAADQATTGSERTDAV